MVVDRFNRQISVGDCIVFIRDGDELIPAVVDEIKGDNLHATSLQYRNWRHDIVTRTSKSVLSNSQRIIIIDKEILSDDERRMLKI